MDTAPARGNVGSLGLHAGSTGSTPNVTADDPARWHVVGSSSARVTRRGVPPSAAPLAYPRCNVRRSARCRAKPEHEAWFRRIAEDYLERPGGDYAELLRRGYVSSPEGVDPEQWRTEIRTKARADKIRVVTIRDGDRAIAARQRSVPKDQERAELRIEFERGEVLRGLAQRARSLGHEIDRWLRHDQEAIAFCARCPARIYVGFRRRDPGGRRRSTRPDLRVGLRSSEATVGGEESALNRVALLARSGSAGLLVCSALHSRRYGHR
jgi:hypothetical protein